MRRRWLLLLMLGLTLVSPVAAHAQRAGMRVQSELDRTGQRIARQVARTRELLERGRSSIDACREPRAHALWAEARDMQRRAEEAGRAGRTLAALQLTQGSRERAMRALQLCNVQERPGDAGRRSRRTDEGRALRRSDDERARPRTDAERALRRTDEVIQQARTRLGPEAPEHARALLARAVETQGRAVQEFRGQRFDACVRLTLSAQLAATRAARAAGRSR